MKNPVFIICLILICSFGIPSGYAENDPIIGAYFYLFDDTYDQVMNNPDDLPWNQFNRLYLAFATIQDGNLTNIEMDEEGEEADTKIKNLVDLCRERNPNAEIIISSNYGDAVTREYLSAASDPDQFARSVRSYLEQYDLDGYDMDWESFDINNYQDEQSDLLQACKAEFASNASLNSHNEPYTLTSTIWPGVHDPETVAGYEEFVDQFNIMSYGPGEGNDLGYYADQYAEAGVPYAKMIGGIESESGYEENGGPDTRDSVSAKAEIVHSRGMAGLMNWRIDNDTRAPDGNATDSTAYSVTGWIYDDLTL